MTDNPRSAGTLRWRILFWMAVAGFGPLLIMAAQGYHCAREGIIQTEETRLRAVLEANKSQLESWFEDRRRDLETLSEPPFADSLILDLLSPASSAKRQAANAILTGFQESRSFYDSIATFDVEWNPLAWSRSASHAGGEGFQTEFRDAPMPDADTVVGLPHLHPDGRLGVHLGRPLMDSLGRRAGYIVANLIISHALDPLLSDANGLGQSGKLYIVSPEGEMLANFSGGSRPFSSSSYLPREMLSNSPVGVSEYDDWRGEPVLGAAAFLPALNWILVAEMDRGEALYWLGALRRRAALAGTATLVFVLMLSTGVSNRLAAPLRQLAGVARRVAAGSHGERVGALEGAEAREVGDAFNGMLDELAENQKRLIQAASLAAVGQLTSSVVHEIRNPLTSLKMNVQALQRKVGEDGPHSELARIAVEQLIRMEIMLSNLLQYGKPLTLNITQVDFEDLAREVVEQARPHAEKKALRMVVRDNMPNGSIEADPDLLRQVLLNLALNAVEAAPPGGEVALEAWSMEGRAQEVDIAALDNGPGIPPELAPRLFQPFFTTRKDGTGLGLAHVKKVAEYHGGSVFAENRPGGGAAFHIRIPRKAQRR